jgi:hypothetical protein
MISDISPEVTLPSQQRRIESVLWHPVADNVLTVTSHTVVKLFDVTQEQIMGKIYDILI